MLKPNVNEEGPTSAEHAAPQPPSDASASSRWIAWDAWKCLGVVLIFTAAFSFLLPSLFKRFPDFFISVAQTPVGRWAIDLPTVAIWVLSAIYFAGTGSLLSFADACGLKDKPTNRAWIAVVLAVVIQLGLILLSHAHTPSSGEKMSLSFRYSARLSMSDLIFLVQAAVWAPLWEETVMRGFLFRAFRRSYSLPVSMIIIIAVMLTTHRTQVLDAWYGGIGISAVTAVLCWIRETSRSLWNCVACHAAFNTAWFFGRMYFP